jgi:toxin CptA
MLLVLGATAACAVLVSEMPRIAAWPLAAGALAHGARRAMQEARQAPMDIVVKPDGTPSVVDGVAVVGMRVAWRGPVAFLQWRSGDGRLQRRAFWPDILPARLRRELRLAAPAPRPARAPASMAP